MTFNILKINCMRLIALYLINKKMVERKREIFIKLDNVKEIVEVLAQIKAEQDELRKLFSEYDRLNLEESKIFESWSNNYEEITQKLDHITL